jgi:hypothetical protein
VVHVNAQLSYEVTVTCQGLPGGLGAGLYVDGASNGTLSSGQTRYFTFSSTGLTHTISLDPYVPTSNGANGTRYYDSNPSWAFSGSGNHTFTYSTQFYLGVQTAYSSISGEGWYDAGSSVQPVLQAGEVVEQQGIRLLFTGWSGDASGANLTSNPITMDGPKNASAIWKTQFLLTLQSDPANVTTLSGSGWYDDGSSANFYAPPSISATSNSRLRFGSWSGDYVGQLANGTVVMDRPKVVTAHFIVQYLLDIGYDPPSVVSSYNATNAGWYDADSYVQIGPAPSFVNVSSVERLSFIGWVDNGRPTSNVSLTIYMDGPHKIVLSYMTQYYIDVESTYGSTSGSGWYNRGSSAQISVSGAETWPIPHVLDGWTVNPSTGSLTKTDDSWSLAVDQPYVLQAQWSIDYLPLMLVGGVGAAVIVVSAGLAVAYRRRRSRVLGSGQVPIARRGCASCGSNLPEGATFCQRCGASAEPVPSAIPSVATVPTLEDKVYDYIANHEGVISLSKAADELGVTVEQLKEITDRLKREGRLT